MFQAEIDFDVESRLPLGEVIQNMNPFRVGWGFIDGCFRHAADTAPLEVLPILRCAIYDPLEGLQISKMRLAEMGGIGFDFSRERLSAGFFQ